MSSELAANTTEICFPGKDMRDTPSLKSLQLPMGCDIVGYLHPSERIKERRGDEQSRERRRAGLFFHIPIGCQSLWH